MNKRSRQIPSNAGTDFARLDAMTEEEIERLVPPEYANLPDDFWDDAVLVYPPGKEPISLRVDEDVLAWFRKNGPGYQSRMNAVLRKFMTAMQRNEPARKRKSKAR
jgi:uncharacterized protein (DUF4415 family)